MSQCSTCYYRQAMCRKCDTLAASLQRDWCRQLFLEFGSYLRERAMPNGKQSLRMERYITFFRLLDQSFPLQMALTAESLFDLVGREMLRRQRIPYQFLVEHGCITPLSGEALEERTQRDVQERLLAQVSPPWKLELLERYRAYLHRVMAAFRARGWSGKHERFHPRTITLLLRAARKFVSSLPEDVMTVQGIDRFQLERFVVTKPGHRNALHSFIRYLNRRESLFQKLTIFQPPARGLPYHQLLSAERVQALLAAWLNPDEKELRGAVIGLLMLLYARTAKQALGLRRQDFTVSRDGAIQFRFGRVPITLDAQAAVVFRRYLAEQEDRLGRPLQMEEFLFPGLMPGRPLSQFAVTYQLSLLGVTAEQLFTTAVADCYRSGLNRPMVLVRTLGISMPTALDYWRAFAPRISEELEQHAGRR